MIDGVAGRAAEGALPDWRGVRVRRPGGSDVTLVPWTTSHDEAVHLTGAAPDPRAEGRWLPLGGLSPFADPAVVVQAVLGFGDGGLRTATFVTAHHDWSPTPWITAELSAAYGEPAERYLPQPGLAEDYGSITWRLPGLQVVHELVGVYAGPSEGAEERIVVTAR